MSMQGQPEPGIPEFTAADRFRKAREKRKMNQRQWAEAIHVDKNTVTAYETGKTKRHVKAIAAAWAWEAGVPVEWILTGEVKDGPNGGGDQAKLPTGRLVASAQVLTFPTRALGQAA